MKEICSTFDEFLEVYSKKLGRNFKFLYEDCYYTSGRLSKIVDLETYLEERLFRPKCSNPDCNNLTKFTRLSRGGWSKACCFKCSRNTEKQKLRTTSMISLAHEKLRVSGKTESQLQASRVAIKACHNRRRALGSSNLQKETFKSNLAEFNQEVQKKGFNEVNLRPERRFNSSLAQYSKYEFIYLYLVIGDELCKFGLSTGSKRIYSSAAIVDAKRILRVELPREVACRIEADLISVGNFLEVPPDISGKFELRTLDELTLLEEFINSALGYTVNYERLL